MLWVVDERLERRGTLLDRDVAFPRDTLPCTLVERGWKRVTVARLLGDGIMVVLVVVFVVVVDTAGTCVKLERRVRRQEVALNGCWVVVEDNKEA